MAAARTDLLERDFDVAACLHALEKFSISQTKAIICFL